jgi:hypothetical protein
MALKTYVDDINDVDEKYRDLYVERDGRLRLDADFEDVGPLKNALTRQKERNTSLSTELDQLKAFKPLLDIEGFDPNDVETLMAKAASAADPQAIENVQREFGKKLDKANSERDEALTAAQKSSADLQTYIISNEVKSAAIKSGVLKESIDDVVLLTRSSFDLDESGKVRVLDEDGDPMGISPVEFFSSQYKEKKPHLFEAKDLSGSSARQSTPGSQSKSWAEASSVQDKVDAIKAKKGN